MWTREQIWSAARAVHPFAVETRRHLHMHPELSFEERETSAYVAAQLEKLSIPFTAGIGGYGIKAVIDGGHPGRTVALRADMDALPIMEETGLPFASVTPGVMHACGHDVHTATLLATARALKERETEIHGRIVLVFQPGEEVNPGGASLMIRDGLLQNPDVDAIFGLHVGPLMEVGTMCFGAGAVQAAPDEFDVTIVGKGGHGAQPHLCVDPVLAAAQCLTLLQQVVARNVGPFQNAVITVGSIHGGAARNVIPDEVTFKGTVRTMDPALRELMPRRIEAIVRGVCEAAGATYRLRYDPGYPALINDEAATDVARRAALHVLAEESVQPMLPSMGGEDFAYYLQQVPGSFGRLGALKPGTANPYGLHTSKLMIDEECLAVGVAYFLSVVQHYLREN
ncbi:MAG TPA: amidohydrolase [Symbiobacteriaceae bacterium]|nr:amidohydrolase [Symbiobacteriaceae bacterium]